MPDITMCKSEGCPLATVCHRNPKSGTRPSDFRQAWHNYDWRWRDTGGETHVVCDNFWPEQAVGVRVPA